MQPATVARGLAWFGIGLGLVEVLAPGAVARVAGLQGREDLLRVFGMREIASGAMILAASEPQRWLWTRVAGDLLDAVVLSEGIRAGGSRGKRALVATAAVAPVVAMDVLYACGLLEPGEMSDPAGRSQGAA